MKLRRETSTTVFCDRAVIVPLSTTYKVLLPKQREANCCTSAIDLVDCQSTSSAWCLEVDSNHRHNGYEPFFLPTELPRHGLTSLFFYIPWLKFASSTVCLLHFVCSPPITITFIIIGLFAPLRSGAMLKKIIIDIPLATPVFFPRTQI